MRCCAGGPALIGGSVLMITLKPLYGPRSTMLWPGCAAPWPSTLRTTLTWHVAFSVVSLAPTGIWIRGVALQMRVAVATMTVTNCEPGNGLVALLRSPPVLLVPRLVA